MKKAIFLILLLVGCSAKYEGEFELVCSISHEMDLHEIDETIARNTYFIKWHEDSTYTSLDNQITHVHGEYTLMLNDITTRQYIADKPITDFTETLGLYFAAIFDNPESVQTDPNTVVKKYVSSALIEINRDTTNQQDYTLTSQLKILDKQSDNCVLTKLRN